VIPARNEPHLQRTIDSILSAARGEIEVIAVLDGYWPDPPIKEDARVRQVHFSEARGMRAAINAGARLAKGEYLMKCDAHCLFDEGFDVKLAQDCRYGWTMVPRRYGLDAESWIRNEGKMYEFQYIDLPSFKGRNWPEYAERVRDNELPNLMTFQGSCWLMHLKRFWWLGGLDDVNYGMMGREAQEISLKTWLSGGRQVLNRKTWYAHWSKPSSNYPGRSAAKEKSIAYAQELWLNDKWPHQRRKLSWLVEKFAPVPANINLIPNGSGHENDKEKDAKGKKEASEGKERDKDAKTEEKDGESKEARAEDSERDIVKGIPEEDATTGRGIRVVRKSGMNRSGLYEYFASLGFKVGAEIGVQRGRNSALMFEKIPGLKLYLVEPYKDYESGNRRYGAANHDKFKRMTLKRLRGKDIVLLEMFSEDAARKVPDDSLDFVYIDGMHLYDFVMQDIILWSRKVREGGIISGHDYDRNSSVVQVMHAINDYVRVHNIDPLYLTDTRAYKVKGDKTTSWFWVNPSRREIIGRIKDSR